MAQTYHTNLVNVATAYIKRLGIKITDTSLRESLTENPYYPSLYALSNVFEKYHIEHTAYKVNKDHVDALPIPFIAYLKNQTTGKDFVMVTSLSSTEAIYIAGRRKPEKVTREAFLRSWLDIVLQAYPDGQGGEADFFSKRKKELSARNKAKALIAGAAFILFATVYLFLRSLPASFAMSAMVLLLIKAIGLTTAILLLIYETDKSNAFVKNICTAGKQTNCEAVLNSKASKVFGMSWSEAGFFYFAGTFLFLLFPAVTFYSKAFVLAVVNGFAVPYVLFSVYYQWKVVKQWCPLCLTVQVVLLSEFVWSIFNVWTTGWNVPSINVLLPMIWCAILPAIVWYVLKPLVEKAKEQPVYKAAYKRLLYNPDTFNHLLQQQPAAPAGYQSLGITIGNPEAKNTIIKVCNPYCGPCAKAHPVLDEIVHGDSNVKLKLIFTASNAKDDIRGIAAKHLLSVNRKNPLQTEQALNDWYLAKKKDYETFARKYPMNGELKEQEPEIEKMNAWCKEAEITFTPTIYINGHRLPEKYKIEELKYIL